ncbi:poly(ethylene terephthalate) hydrolase family protein [Streptomyces sp. NPDC000880]
MQHISAPLRRAARRAALGLVLALGGALIPAVSADASTAPVVTDTSPDGDWSVAPVAGGFRVTLRLPKPLQVRDALPELAVDGAPVGVARQSPDGRTLTVVTTDPAAADPSSVRLAWNGQVPGASAAKVPGATTDPGSAGKALKADPSVKGAYSVSRADYDFGDTAVSLSGLGGRQAEMRAAVWVPTDARGARPVVIFLHGRHAACYNPTAGTTNNTVWPCPDGFKPIPSYQGYNTSAEALASRGYVVVSVSADGINAQDNPYSDDAGTLARGQLILDHLDLLAKADTGHAAGMSPLLKGRLDLRDVGVMGHSRGGEGMVKAALLNAALPHPYGIKAVLPLAPIDFGRETLPDVPMAVILPYCDGDVSNQQGQHFYDDTRYATDDNVMRSSVMVMGADHNFFNTEWTPGVAVAPSNDDWQNQDDPTCGMNAPTTTRLSASNQYQVGVDYITGFFRLVMGQEKQFLPMFDGSAGRATQVGAATVHAEFQAPSDGRLDVATLQAAASNVSFTGAASGQYCASMAGRSPVSGLPSCTDSTQTARFPSFTPANYGPNVTATPLLHLTWGSSGTAAGDGSMVVDLPKGRYNVSRYGALTLRAARDDLSAEADLTLTVVDGSGRSRSVKVSSLSDAMAGFPGTGTLLPKVWLRTVRWPVSQMTGVNVHDIRRIKVSTATPAGGAFLSDLAFQTSAVGAGGPSRLPQVSIAGTTVDETAGTATVTLSLSHTTRLPVIAYVQSLAGTGTQIANLAQQVVIPGRKSTATVRIPVTSVDGEQGDTPYKVFVLDPTNAVVGQDFARVVVHDDPATS